MQLVYIPFIIVVLLCLIPIKNKTIELLFTSLAIALMISLFAFNNSSVDQFAYKVLYSDYNYFPVEKGYLVLTGFFNALHCDYAMFKALSSLILVVLLYVRFRKYSVKGFRIALLVYFLSSYCFDAEQSRFTFAAAIVVLGSFFLEKKGVLPLLGFIALVVIASTIHTSCLFYGLLLLVKLRTKTISAISAFFVAATIIIGTTRMDLSFIGEIVYSLVPNERVLMWFDFETRFGWVGPLLVQILFYGMLEMSKRIVLHNPNVKKEHMDFVLFAHKICLVLFIATPLYCFATDFIRLTRVFFILYLSAITTAFWYAPSPKKVCLSIFLVVFPFFFAAQGIRGLIIFNDYYVSTLVKQNEIMDNLFVTLGLSIALFVALLSCENCIGKTKRPLSYFGAKREAIQKEPCQQ